MSRPALRSPAPQFGLAQTLGALGWAVTSLGLGAAAALGAYAVNPLAVPALLIGFFALLVTLRRPEVGIATWFVLVALGPTGAVGSPGWVVPSAWAVVLFAVALVRGRLEDRTLPPLTLALLAVLALTVVQATRTASLGDAIPIVRVLVVGTLLFGSIALLVRSREQVVWVLGGLTVGGALIAALAVQEWAAGASGVGFFTTDGQLVTRAAGSFGQPNALAGFLLVVLPAGVGVARVARGHRLMGYAAVVLILVGIYVTFSRGALLGLAVVPFVFLGLRRSLIVAPLIAAAAFSVTPDVLRERFATAGVGGAEATTRIDFWRTANAIWQERPVLGVGPGGFPDAYATARIPGKQFLPSTQFQPPPHAHNLELHLLAEQGIVGLAALAALLAAGVAALLRLRRHAEGWVRTTATTLLATFLAFLVHNQLDFTLLETTGQVLYASLGLVSALAMVPSPDPPAAAG